MGRVRAHIAVVVAVVATLCMAPRPSPGVAFVREKVSFKVTNPLAPLRTYTVRGVLVRPAAGCAHSVILAMHGLSYGKWAWDFPLHPELYSVAEAMANRGYAMVAVDELGYGSSAGEGSPAHPNGYTLTVEGYGEMAAQIAGQLRTGAYTAAAPTAFRHVGLIGHSAGSEIVELAAGFHPGIADLLIATGYSHEPFVNNKWLQREWIPGDNVRALQDDYEYFETNPTIRKHDMYNLALADSAVVALDNKMANLTPSGEILSINPQPSRFVMGLIRIPVLLVMGGKDELFPARFGDKELALFALALDKTLLVAPEDGHVFMLQTDAQATFGRIADWLDARNAVFPKC